MQAAKNRRLTWTAATIVSVGLALGWASAAGAVAIPGEPTASECQIIAQQALDNGVTFEAGLAANGGGVCPAASVLGVTVKPAVVVAAAAAVPAAALPKSGSNVTGPLMLGSMAILIGGALIIINRRRTTPAVAEPQPVPTITRSLPPPLLPPFGPPSGPPLLRP